MKDKVVICTGASSGVGLATATALIEAGSKVLGVDISPCPGELSSSTNFKFAQINLAESGSAEKIVDECKNAFGDKIDCLLNIAGIMDNFQSADTLDDETWDRVIAVNLTAPVKLMRAAVRVMLKQDTGGTIVNVSSKAGVSGAVSGLAYASSKHGLIGATQNVAWRFRHNKVRCNVICPGVVKTNIQQSADASKFDMEAMEQSKNAYSVHTPEDYLESSNVASLIVYMASDASFGLNGAVVPIDNAWSTVANKLNINKMFIGIPESGMVVDLGRDLQATSLRLS